MILWFHLAVSYQSSSLISPLEDDGLERNLVIPSSLIRRWEVEQQQRFAFFLRSRFRAPCKPSFPPWVSPPWLNVTTAKQAGLWSQPCSVSVQVFDASFLSQVIPQVLFLILNYVIYIRKRIISFHNCLLHLFAYFKGTWYQHYQ